MVERKASVQRSTLETQIQVEVNLDGTGTSVFKTGVPFLEHMLDQVARHGMIDMEVNADGDLQVDAIDRPQPGAPRPQSPAPEPASRKPHPEADLESADLQQCSFAHSCRPS